MKRTKKKKIIEPVHSGKRILLIVEDNRDICDYIVESIDGDYAHLRRTDLPEEELKLVARALLPFVHHRRMQITL